jgi:hypothetical protein
MKTKHFLFFMVLALIVPVFGLYAAGEQEGEASVAPWGVAELVTVTGTVSQDVGRRPELVSGSDRYLLMYPLFLAESVELEQGETVTVEGYVSSGPRWGGSEETPYLRINKVSIRGKEYVIDNHGPGMMQGRRPGFQGAPGRPRQGRWQ